MSGEEILSGQFDGSLKEVYGSVIVRENRWDEALSLGLSGDPRIAFRASWALEWAFFCDTAGFMPYLDDFIENLRISDNGSLHRHYVKMLAHLLKRGVCLSPEQNGVAVSKCFDLLIDPGTKVAVKAWCTEVVYSLRASEDWIAGALADILRDMLACGDISPGMANHAGKMLKRLSRAGKKMDSGIG